MDLEPVSDCGVVVYDPAEIARVARLMQTAGSPSVFIFNYKASDYEHGKGLYDELRSNHSGYAYIFTHTTLHCDLTVRPCRLNGRELIVFNALDPDSRDLFMGRYSITLRLILV